MDENDTLQKRLREYGQIIAFSAMNKNFDDPWPEDGREPGRLPLFRSWFDGKDGLLRYQRKICVLHRGIPDLLQLAYDTRVVSPSESKNPKGRVAQYH